MDDTADRIAAGSSRIPVLRWRGGVQTELDDWVCEEVPVALEYNGVSHAVMLATPLDLDDFALGFSLGEGILDDPAELYDLQQERDERGITLKLEVASRCFDALKVRRRTLAGRTGCGLCGTDDLTQAVRPLPHLPDAPALSSRAIARAVCALHEHQPLARATGAVHAAAFCDVAGRIVLAREDVGRHNALDKLVGALRRAGIDAAAGFMLVSSRASVEMVQKAANAGCGLLVAVSAPTALAVSSAISANMGLLGLARGDDFVIYSGRTRVRIEQD